MKIIITKLERYPSENPNSWAVGFNVETENQRSFYIETQVPFLQRELIGKEMKETKADNDKVAVDIAYKELEAQIKSQVEELEKTSSLLGQIYEPK